MGNSPAIIPISVFAAIAVCMLIFICWWFPRTWNKGNAADKEEYDAMTRRRAAWQAAQRDGETTDVELGPGGEGEGGGGVTVPPPAQVKRPGTTYIPPVAVY